MGVTVTSHITLPSHIPLTNRQVMRELGLLAREIILRRTAQGQGVDGPFKPYSPGYAKQKAAALGSGPVNLQASGAMLNALTLVDIQDDSVTLGFSS